MKLTKICQQKLGPNKTNIMSSNYDFRNLNTERQKSINVSFFPFDNIMPCLFLCFCLCNFVGQVKVVIIKVIIKGSLILSGRDGPG